MLANQIEVATQTTIRAAQPSIDAAILESSKHSTCELRSGKNLQHFAITEIFRRLRNGLWQSPGALALTVRGGMVT